MVEFNGKNYSYIYNQHNDIVAIVNNVGQIVIQYSYDAWGENVRTQYAQSSEIKKLMEINPFGYGGYIKDTETGLLYLRDRYYATKRGRFVNSDACLSRNIFSYCYNSTVNLIDEEGTAPTAPPRRTVDPQDIHDAMVEWARQRTYYAALHSNNAIKADNEMTNKIDFILSKHAENTMTIRKRISDVYVSKNEDGTLVYKVLVSGQFYHKNGNRVELTPIGTVALFTIEFIPESITWGDTISVLATPAEGIGQYGSGVAGYMGYSRVSAAFTILQAVGFFCGYTYFPASPMITFEREEFEYNVFA